MHLALCAMPYTTCASNQMSLPAESMGPVHLAWPGSAAQGKPRRRQARQAVALRRPGKTRKVSPGFEKYCMWSNMIWPTLTSQQSRLLHCVCSPPHFYVHLPLPLFWFSSYVYVFSMHSYCLSICKASVIVFSMYTLTCLPPEKKCCNIRKWYYPLPPE